MSLLEKTAFVQTLQQQRTNRKPFVKKTKRAAASKPVKAAKSKKTVVDEKTKPFYAMMPESIRLELFGKGV